MMKRIYTFALLAALMLAGCEREEQRSDLTCPEKTLQFTLNVLTGLYSSLT